MEKTCQPWELFYRPGLKSRWMLDGYFTVLMETKWQFSEFTWAKFTEKWITWVSFMWRCSSTLWANIQDVIVGAFSFYRRMWMFTSFSNTWDSGLRRLQLKARTRLLIIFSNSALKGRSWTLWLQQWNEKPNLKLW